MIEVARPLVVGIGSPHGDDQAGWLLIERLSSQVSSQVRLRTASVPHNLIDWSDDCDALYIIDACDDSETVMRIELSDENSTAKIDRPDTLPEFPSIRNRQDDRARSRTRQSATSHGCLGNPG